MRCLSFVLFVSSLLAQDLDNFGSEETTFFEPFNSRSYLTPTALPYNSIYISWNTLNAESTKVAYGLTQMLGDTAGMAGMYNYHHVLLTGLKPATEYYYKILPNGCLKKFKTFPLKSDTCTFVVYGDTRSDSAAHRLVVNEMACANSDFMIHVGDYVNTGDSTDDWNMYFKVADTLLQSTMLIPAIGNHESPYWPYDTLFPLPDAEDYYSVDYGNVHTVILNTEMDLLGTQLSWLINDLQNANDNPLIDWIIVNFHRPPYSSGNHGSQLDVRDAWCSIFEKYNIDMVFSGHEHNYERTFPIHNIVYIIAGGGGAPLRDVGRNSWTAYSEKTFHFCFIQVSGLKLVMRAIKPDGTIFDSLIIEKSPDLRNRYIFTEVNDITISPNPFLNKLTISYTLYESERVGVEIYDCLGSLVRTLSHGQQQTGEHQISWDGADDFGHQTASGDYFLIFKVGGRRIKRKIIKAGNY